ncbi:uncharacterized protein LOC142086251 [Calonectris borealis]|uniref:uncharacterized protein LOC142086251 n=1 Tax=Calonectris borealis TaxID=1323832 RepID=UPI003F4BF1C8
MERLQGADSDASAAALPVLGNMLQLLEGKMPSLTALALAEKLPPLFSDVRLGESPRPLSPGTSIRASRRSPRALQGDALPRKPPDPIAALGGSVLHPKPPAWTHPSSASLLGGGGAGGTAAGVLSPSDAHPALAASPSPPQGLPLWPPAPLGRPSACHSSLPFGAGLPVAVLGTSISTSAPCSPWAPLFPQELDTVRELSIRLFQKAMGLVVGAEKKKMKKVVWDSLLPLVFHLYDQDKTVAKASQEALCSAGQFLQWGQLAQLAETAQAWRISECLLARKKSRAEDYLRQSELYLQSPQESLWQEAVRLIGLIGRQVDKHERMEYIRKVLQEAKNDTSPLVSSLATQTRLILSRRRLSSRFSLQQLSLRLRRAWARWRSAPSEDSARAETKQQP